MNPEDRLGEAIKQAELAKDSDRVGPAGEWSLDIALKNLRDTKRELVHVESEFDFREIEP